MGWESLTERVTHHSAGGKFCSPSNAVTVTKDGERYKVVRQHRKLKPKVTETAEAIRDRGVLALARAGMRGWTNVSDLLDGRVDYRIEGVDEDGSLSVVFVTRPARFPVIEYRGHRWSAHAGTLDVGGKFRTEYRKEGSFAFGTL